MKTRKEVMAEQWWKAVSDFGEDEAVEVVAELWGISTYRVKQEVDKIEEDLWL